MKATRKPPTDATLADALALGGGREATTAHPMCWCVATKDCGIRHRKHWTARDKVICDVCRDTCPVHGSA